MNNNRSTYKVGSDLKKHFMTGISYMIPAIVMGGFLIAIALIIGGESIYTDKNSLGYLLNTAGSTAMSLVVPVLSAYIAFSIGDKPGIAPGLLAGALALNIKAGFLGGMLGGIIVGYSVLWIIKYVKVPKPMKPLMSVLIVPLLAGIIISLLMLVVIGPPIAHISAWAVQSVQNMNIGSRFMLGAILGAMTGFDLGGPVNKISFSIVTAFLADGVLGPVAGKNCAAMTPPLGIAWSALVFARNKYTEQERQAAKVAIPLGFCQISEGALPFAIADPLRVMPATAIGSAIADGLCMMWLVTSPVPHGGILAVPIMGNPLGFIGALIIGSLVTGIILSIIKPSRPAAAAPDETVSGEEDSEEDSDIAIRID